MRIHVRSATGHSEGEAITLDTAVINARVERPDIADV
jgi:hypothetical protein